MGILGAPNEPSSIYVYVYIYMCIYYVCIYVCIDQCIYVCIYVYMFLCWDVYVHAYGSISAPVLQNVSGNKRAPVSVDKRASGYVYCVTRGFLWAYVVVTPFPIDGPSSLLTVARREGMSFSSVLLPCFVSSSRGPYFTVLGIRNGTPFPFDASRYAWK